MLGRTYERGSSSGVFEQEALAQQQVEAARAKIEAFEEKLTKAE
jgi:hypothetical protein